MPAGPLWFNGATIQNTPAMNGTALAASLYVIGGATVKTVKQAANASLKTSLRIGPQPTSKHSLRWLELRGEKPVPETTEEGLSREGELEVPLRAMITRDGDWDRVSEVQFAEDMGASVGEFIEANGQRVLSALMRHAMKGRQENDPNSLLSGVSACETD